MAFIAAAGLPLLLSTGATVAVGAYSAIQQKKAGDIQAAELKAQAKTEAVAAGQREIDRRRNLIRALSSQNAAAGAAGVETSGSVAAIARSDIRDASNDLLYSNMNSTARQRALRSQAGNASRIGRTNAAVSLLDSADKAYRAVG